MNSELDIALTFFFVIFVIIDIFVNVVLCMAIHRKRSLQTPMNLLIFHLAITDIVIGVFVIPRHILSYVIIYPNNLSSDYICRLFTGGGFIWTSVTAASGFLTIIALERLFAVVYPHKSKLRITKRRLKWLVAACWLSSFAFNLPSQLVLKYDHERKFCLENWPQWVNPKAYVGLAFCAGNFSVFTMFVIYSIILYSLWKRRKGASEVSRTARINARKRVTKMLILMTIVHMLCRTPNYTFYTMIYFDPSAKYGSIVYNFTVFLILLNSASHPFFYCWYMDSLRKQVFDMLPQGCSGRCPSRLMSFNLVSTGDGVGSTTPEARKHQGDGLMYSCTLGSDSAEKQIDKVDLQVNREVDVNDSSGYLSKNSTPMTENKQLKVPLNISNLDCENDDALSQVQNDDGSKNNNHNPKDVDDERNAVELSSILAVYENKVNESSMRKEKEISNCTDNEESFNETKGKKIKICNGDEANISGNTKAVTKTEDEES